MKEEIRKIGVGELRKNITEVLNFISYNRISYIVTRRGKPVAWLRPVTEKTPPGELKQ